MKENEIATILVDACITIHRELGPGIFESIYEEILYTELKLAGIEVERQVPINVYWKGVKLEIGFRADLILEKKVVVELKSVEHIIPVHKKQVMTYLKLTGLKLGLLLNFNSALMKDGIVRLVNGLEEV